jgi:hydrogenase/urease accessory protein HupE
MARLSVPVGDGVVAASLLVVGGLAALDAPLPPSTIASLAGLLGVLHGFTDGSTISLDRDGIRSLLGIVAAVFTVFALTWRCFCRCVRGWRGRQCGCPGAGSQPQGFCS